VDFRKLGNVLMAAGTVILVAAVIWWASFYSSLARDFGQVTGVRPNAGLSDVLSCLYSTSGVCGLVSAGASIAGKTPYEPMLFWFALAALMLGGVIRFTAKPPGTA